MSDKNKPRVYEAWIDIDDNLSQSHKYSDDTFIELIPLADHTAIVQELENDLLNHRSMSQNEREELKAEVARPQRAIKKAQETLSKHRGGV